VAGLPHLAGEDISAGGLQHARLGKKRRIRLKGGREPKEAIETGSSDEKSSQEREGCRRASDLKGKRRIETGTSTRIIEVENYAGMAADASLAVMRERGLSKESCQRKRASQNKCTRMELGKIGGSKGPWKQGDLKKRYLTVYIEDSTSRK